MATVDFTAALREHERELRQRLSEWAGDGREPEEGSDAWLLLRALCGAAPEVYLPRFEASARHLAEQGGRLDIRLAGIQRWQEALATACADIFRAEPEQQARAEAFLASLAAQIVVRCSREYYGVKAREAEEIAERAQRGATRLQALQRVNNAVNSTLDLDQTLSTAAAAIAEALEVDLCVIHLFDEANRGLELRATSGPYPRTGRHTGMSLGQGYSGWVAEHGHPLLVHDALADQRFAHEASAYETPYRGLLSVPIIFFTVLKLEGVLSVQSVGPRQFSHEDVSFLEVVAGQLAMNIENARLYEQTDEALRRRVHELSTLHRVWGLVTSSLVLDNVLANIVSQAVLLTGADRSVLFELDGASQRLRAVARHGFDHPDVMNATAAVGDCCVGRVTRTGEPSMRVDCMRTDEGCFLRGLPDAIDDQHAVLCAPLGTVHGPLGALCVTSSQRHMLNEHQLQLVETFANVAAIAMENARLFEQTRQGLRTKETLLREMHHRVKNNLQQVASILNMQRRRTRVPEVEQVLVESVDRIQGIAATHDLLSHAELGRAPVDEIARKIVGIVSGNLVPPQQHIRFVVGRAPFAVPTEQATTVAIILNELIANAIEHGFDGRERGEIRVSAARLDGHIALRVADDGQGLPEGFSLRASEGLGLQLVRGLVHSDLRGSFEVFAVHGAPDVRAPSADLSAGATDPALAAISMEESQPGAADPPGVAEQVWTVAEIRFPVDAVVIAASEV